MTDTPRWKTKQFIAHFADEIMCKRDPNKFFWLMGDRADVLARLVGQGVAESGAIPSLFAVDPRNWRNLSQIAQLLQNRRQIATRQEFDAS